jgi:hypothetical protein
MTVIFIFFPYFQSSRRMLKTVFKMLYKKRLHFSGAAFEIIYFNVETERQPVNAIA